MQQRQLRQRAQARRQLSTPLVFVYIGHSKHPAEMTLREHEMYVVQW